MKITICPYYDCPVRGHKNGYEDQCSNCQRFKDYVEHKKETPKDITITYTPKDIADLEKDIIRYVKRGQEYNCKYIVIDYLRLISKLVPISKALKIVSECGKEYGTNRVFILDILSSYDLHTDLAEINVPYLIDLAIRSNNMNRIDKAIRCLENWEDQNLINHVIDFSEPYRDKWDQWVIDYYNDVTGEEPYDY